jgi:hypothetical protein
MLLSRRFLAEERDGGSLARWNRRPAARRRRLHGVFDAD